MQSLLSYSYITNLRLNQNPTSSLENHWINRLLQFTTLRLQ